MKRHAIREVAFQILFAMESNETTNLAELYQQLKLQNKELSPEIPAYLELLVTGVHNHLAELNDLLIKYLKAGWSLQRLNKADLVIMQLATFEIKFVAETPNRVAVDEALELAREYSDEASRKFINGVLSNLIQQEN
ncbi:MAG: transcription antitermination factor NusB [Liquorilactobacillus nagelii]|jgi:N utilization substance protein B|uniref:Transcription antitermination protein NusB n=1 Tax=Liquorilactobacillus nagelii TaxID=82688 RepID=A0A3S6R165_9LACO|nr:transcription antitermination factor NusB [Liquorilactobacillus nagelii]AUJ32277.1 N utilization substance protein B [Liquorilactobacillus nagelii]KRL40811.1 transcription antitermination protein NusB [Liquorilactobacillus nagelii DSM 13675]MCC7615452.1 transcription antitermination factor NusB [Liquorilactobacillus nagelii]MCI1632399.1 transcription antitermination factor NusB [Liquorilactobacillus nagelii]MCI1699500.1 transcription antitermination factor NusB [Liquorilactobacillus nagelii